jgi:hypothetical protein
MKITKKDARVFVLGMIAFLAIECIYNWKESKDAFTRGYKSSLTLQSPKSNTA